MYYNELNVYVHVLANVYNSQIWNYFDAFKVLIHTIFIKFYLIVVIGQQLLHFK